MSISRAHPYASRFQYLLATKNLALVKRLIKNSPELFKHINADKDPTDIALLTSGYVDLYLELVNAGKLKIDYLAALTAVAFDYKPIVLKYLETNNDLFPNKIAEHAWRGDNLAFLTAYRDKFVKLLPDQKKMVQLIELSTETKQCRPDVETHKHPAIDFALCAGNREEAILLSDITDVEYLALSTLNAIASKKTHLADTFMNKLVNSTGVYNMMIFETPGYHKLLLTSAKNYSDDPVKAITELANGISDPVKQKKWLAAIRETSSTQGLNDIFTDPKTKKPPENAPLRDKLSYLSKIKAPISEHQQLYKKSKLHCKKDIATQSDHLTCAYQAVFAGEWTVAKSSYEKSMIDTQSANRAATVGQQVIMHFLTAFNHIAFEYEPTFIDTYRDNFDVLSNKNPGQFTVVLDAILLADLSKTPKIKTSLEKLRAALQQHAITSLKLSSEKAEKIDKKEVFYVEILARVAIIADTLILKALSSQFTPPTDTAETLKWNDDTIAIYNALQTNLELVRNLMTKLKINTDEIDDSIEFYSNEIELLSTRSKVLSEKIKQSSKQPVTNEPVINTQPNLVPSSQDDVVHYPETVVLNISLKDFLNMLPPSVANLLLFSEDMVLFGGAVLDILSGVRAPVDFDFKWLHALDKLLSCYPNATIKQKSENVYASVTFIIDGIEHDITAKELPLSMTKEEYLYALSAEGDATVNVMFIFIRNDKVYLYDPRGGLAHAKNRILEFPEPENQIGAYFSHPEWRFRHARKAAYLELIPSETVEREALKIQQNLSLFLEACDKFKTKIERQYKRMLVTETESKALEILVDWKILAPILHLNMIASDKILFKLIDIVGLQRATIILLEQIGFNLFLHIDLARGIPISILNAQYQRMVATLGKSYTCQLIESADLLPVFLTLNFIDPDKDFHVYAKASGVDYAEKLLDFYNTLHFLPQRQRLVFSPPNGVRTFGVFSTNEAEEATEEIILQQKSTPPS